MITQEGLEDQLLGIVVAKERYFGAWAQFWFLKQFVFNSRPELEEERQQLVQQAGYNNRALKEVEDSILNTLSESEGNILEDESAIQILDSSKKISKDIIEKQAIATQTEKLIEKNRLAYRPIAK